MKKLLAFLFISSVLTLNSCDLNFELVTKDYRNTSPEELKLQEDTYNLKDMVVDSKGNIFFTESNTYKIKKITPDGKVSTFVEDLEKKDLSTYGYKYDLEIDSKDNLFLFLNDQGKYRKVIKKITPDGKDSDFFEDKKYTLYTYLTIDKYDNVIGMNLNNKTRLYESLKIAPNGELLKNPIYYSFEKDNTLPYPDSEFIIDSKNNIYMIPVLYERGWFSFKIIKYSIDNKETILGDELKYSIPFLNKIVIDSNDNVYFVSQSVKEPSEKKLTFIYQIIPYNIVLPKFVGYFSNIYSLSIDKRKNILYLASKASIYKVKL